MKTMSKKLKRIFTMVTPALLLLVIVVAFVVAPFSVNADLETWEPAGYSTSSSDDDDTPPVAGLSILKMCTIVPDGWSKANPFAWLGNTITCAILFIVYTFWNLTNWVLTLAGAMFDMFAAFTIGTVLFKSTMTMTQQAWGVVRDIANLALIFSLLYIAIATILQIGGVQLKKAVASVVIVGLLINFSFFITRVVIDASNILAGALYSKVVANSAAESNFVTSIGGVPVKSVSSSIIAAFNPQQIMDQTVVDKLAKADMKGQNVFTFLYLFASILNIFAAIIFLKVALLLVGRVVMFLFLIIASPLAFVGYAIPGASFHKEWWKTLIDQAMVAPVFFFFLYVITTVLNGSFLDSIFKSSKDTLDPMTFYISMTAHFIIVILALNLALKKTAKLSGEIGGAILGFAGGLITGAVGGATVGLAARAGRHTIGRAAKSLQDSAAVKQFVARTGVAGEVLDRGLGATARGSMDFRGISGVEGMGKAGGKGGYDKHLKDQIGRKVELGKRLEKGKHGENVLATNWRGKAVTEMETQYEERDVMEEVEIPSSVLGPGGKPIMQKVKRAKMGADGKPVKEKVAVGEKQRWITAREQYTRKLEQGTTIFPDFKKQGYEASRNDRDAARELRKTPTETEKIIEGLLKASPPPTPTP